MFRNFLVSVFRDRESIQNAPHNFDQWDKYDWSMGLQTKMGPVFLPGKTYNFYNLTKAETYTISRDPRNL